MKNSEVAQLFAEGKSENAEGSNMFIADKGRVLYSYGYHFPIAVRLEDFENSKIIFLVNEDKYSVSTSKHQGYFNRAINFSCKLIEMNTQQLKHFIDMRDFDVKAVALMELEK